MPTRLFIDFETRSRVDLKKTGAHRYSTDPSTTLLCYAWAIDDGQVQLWQPGDQHPQWDGVTEYHAHNAAFERAIVDGVCVPRLGWQPIGLKVWHCTAARCACLGLPRSLDGAAKAMGTGGQKDSSGHRVLMKYTKTRRPTKTNRYEWHDDPAELAEIYEYCRQDVAVERELWRLTPEPSPRERAIWLLDQIVNDRGVPIDREMVLSVLRLIGSYGKRLGAELTLLTDREVTGGNQHARLKDWLIGQGLDCLKTDKTSVQEMLDSGVGDPAKRVLEIRQELGRSSTAKYQAFLNRVQPDDRVRGVHLYYGAGTGRWAGRGVQLQNIPRGGLEAESIEPAIKTVVRNDLDSLEMLYGGVSETLVSLIRPVIWSRDSRLLVADFASIEARVLAWLAGERKLLADYEAGRDPYISLAAQIFGVHPCEVTKDQRFVGKTAILGLGYQMGAKRFSETANVDEVFSEQVVKTYRTTYEAIPKFWYAVQDACIDVVKNLTVRKLRKLRFRIEDRWLFIDLPSGRPIAYYRPAVVAKKTDWGVRDSLTYLSTDAINHQFRETDTFGGKLVENIVQAVSRDLLADAMFRVERAGYPVVFHVHDEIVSERAGGTLDGFCGLMAQVPRWASDCPIAVEGFESRRYRK